MQNLLDNLREYMELLDHRQLREVLHEVPAPELIEMWPALDSEEAHKIFLLLKLDQKVDLMRAISLGEQEDLLKSLSLDNMRQVFQEMEPDDLVDIIQEVGPEVRESVWSSLDQEARKETQFLLKFDEDDAAGLMTPRYLAIRPTITVGQAISFIRANGRDVETVYYVYVVDRVKRLLGVVSMKDLFFTDDTVRVEHMMTTEPTFVYEETDQEDTARTLEAHDLIAVPVLDQYHRLLGIVTFDDIIDVIREEQTEDVYKMGAMEGSADVYVQTSVFRLIRKRIPWLIILLLAGTITTNVLHFFEDVYIGAAFLVLFVPVITQTGGNSGTQSSTLMIRGIATGEVHLRDTWRILVKELAVGLLMGVLLGGVIFLRGVFLPPGIEVFQGLAVGLSLVFVVLLSSLIGAVAPLLIHKLGFDPTVMAGPLMATVIDLIGLTIYFNVARLLLGL